MKKKKKKKSRKPRKEKRRAKIRRLDKLWAFLVKETQGWYCHWCGKRDLPRHKIHADHIKTRSHYPTRWRVENGIPLCLQCHLWRKRKDPLGWAKMVGDHKSVDLLDELTREANRPGKTDLDQVEVYLGNIKKGLDDLKAER